MQNKTKLVNSQTETLGSITDCSGERPATSYIRSDSFHAVLALSCGRAKCQCCTATLTVVVYISYFFWNRNDYKPKEVSVSCNLDNMQLWKMQVSGKIPQFQNNYRILKEQSERINLTYTHYFKKPKSICFNR